MKRWLAIPALLILAALLAFHPVPTALVVAAAGAQSSAAPIRRPGRRAAGKHRHHAGARASGEILIDVAGAVVHPGLYRLAPDARATDALHAAGGLRPGADADRVDLAAMLRDGDEVLVPLLGAPRRRSATIRGSRARRSKRSKKGAQLAGESIDLNAADAVALAEVPGIGPLLAARIVELRRRDGPYDALDQLLDVAGMSPSRLDQARPYLKV
ncbi:MAG TPA: helix-hairpin-helix domain-containing protein [Candidatus Dormibacteraeota bacterium]|nr:helix-hairpin-helix domain-containing protein [Candidatus Dormibacteraeota bacterium]